MGIIMRRSTDCLIGLNLLLFTYIAFHPVYASNLTVSNINPTTYEWDTMEIGKLMFVDRDYIFTDLPQGYVGLDMIRTSKLDRTTTGDNFIAFDVDVPVTVYVAHADSITNKPAWLQGWIDTGDDMVNRSIYSRSFAAGTITLGGNTADGLDSGSMYMILLEPSLNSIPQAVPDSTTTDMNSSINIDILRNDNNLTDLPLTVSIIEVPTNGGAILEEDNTITYTPVDDFIGTDVLKYEITDGNGDKAVTAAYISVKNNEPMVVSNITPVTYEPDTLEIGKLMFVDRDYTFMDLPQEFTGMTMVRTSKLDRTSNGDNFVSFVVNIPVTIYIAHDNQITNKPAWLLSWTDTGVDMVGRSIFSKDFGSGTITLGGNTADGVDAGSMYMVLIEPLSNTIPHAAPDAYVAQLNTVANFDILANDSNLTDQPIAVSIIEPPVNGTGVLEADNTITYTPADGFIGGDSLFYQVVDYNGDLAISNVSIDVQCSACPTDVLVTLSWTPNTDNIQGYAVYYGLTGDTANQLISELPLDSELINPQSPSVQYNLAEDLELIQADSTCFRLKAYNEFGFSDFSNAACL